MPESLQIFALPGSRLLAQNYLGVFTKKAIYLYEKTNHTITKTAIGWFNR